MKLLLALAAACAGVSAAGAVPVPVHPTYASRPSRKPASDDAVRITNFSALDSGRDRPGAPRAGVQLARAGAATSPAQPQGVAGHGSDGQGSGHRQAIYGHNVNDVIIGALRGAHQGSNGQGVAHQASIYSTTIEDYAACRAARGHHPGVAARPCEKVTSDPNGIGWRARRSGNRMVLSYYSHVGQRAIIYNGTITSEPTNALACGRAGGGDAHPAGGISLKGAKPSGGCTHANTYTKPEPVIIYNGIHKKPK